jgi:hypothetical protein
MLALICLSIQLSHFLVVVGFAGLRTSRRLGRRRETERAELRAAGVPGNALQQRAVDPYAERRRELDQRVDARGSSTPLQ